MLGILKPFKPVPKKYDGQDYSKCVMCGNPANQTSLNGELLCENCILRNEEARRKK